MGTLWLVPRSHGGGLRLVEVNAVALHRARHQHHLRARGTNKMTIQTNAIVVYATKYVSFQTLAAYPAAGRGRSCQWLMDCI